LTMPSKATVKHETPKDVSVVLKEDDWHYVLAKLRKAIEPGCYEKSYCQLLDVIPKIERQVKAAGV
jgi:hypothetical protein